MEAAPNATLVTHAFSALRMSTWWPVPMDRVHAIRLGDEIHVGDRTLTAVAPPLFDNPMSIGALDRSTGALFTVDAFGALLPEPRRMLRRAPEALAGGMIGWATSDSPWVHITDPAEFGQVLDRVRQIQPRRIFSSHLPVASGTALEDFRPPSTWNATRALLDCAVDGVAANCRLFSSPSAVSRSGWARVDPARSHHPGSDPGERDPAVGEQVNLR